MNTTTYTTFGEAPRNQVAGYARAVMFFAMIALVVTLAVVVFASRPTAYSRADMASAEQTTISDDSGGLPPVVDARLITE